MARYTLCNLTALHVWPTEKHAYYGGIRSVQRSVAEPCPPQAKVDWAQFPRLVIVGDAATFNAFHLALSHSRFGAVIWTLAEDRLCWMIANNAAFERNGGIPRCCAWTKQRPPRCAGGVHLLSDECGGIAYEGRIKNLSIRKSQHANPKCSGKCDLFFSPWVQTDSYDAQRGAEQIAYDLYGQGRNKQRPIRPNNPKRNKYLKAGCDCVGKQRPGELSAWLRLGKK